MNFWEVEEEKFDRGSKVEGSRDLKKEKKTEKPRCRRCVESTEERVLLKRGLGKLEPKGGHGTKGKGETG